MVTAMSSVTITKVLQKVLCVTKKKDKMLTNSNIFYKKYIIFYYIVIMLLSILFYGVMSRGVYAQEVLSRWYCSGV